MIDARRAQRTFGDGFVADAVPDWQEAWMPHADAILDDDAVVSIVYEALAKRHPKSRTRGRRGSAAEMVVRVLVLKHVRHWSYAMLEREVRTNLMYRAFTRVGGGAVPDAKTMGRWGIAVGPDVIVTLHRRLIAIAQEQHVVEGRKMRVDTTVVETNIHYPTDSSLLGDGVRVLTRAMKKATAIAGRVGAILRDRRRSVTHRLLDIGRIARSKTAARQERLVAAYERLLAATSRVVGQAKRFSREIGAGVKRGTDILQQAALDGVRQELDTVVPRVQQVMRQARATPHSTRPRMKPRPTRRASRASAFRTGPPKVLNANANRGNGGSRTGRRGARDVRGASASSSGGTDCSAVATKATTG